ncbi:MAG: hypothetical protein ACR2P1_12415 [Pseudomonadales bacterium]
MYINEKLSETPIPMSQFNIINVACIANDLLATINDPRRRQILINFRDHALAECHGDTKALLATCSQKCQRYETFGAGDEFSDMQPQNYEQLCAYYGALVDMNQYIIHFDCEKLIVGDDELVIEGIVHQLLDGKFCRELHGVLGLEDNSVYQSSIRVLTIFVFDENGLGCGEQSYSTSLKAKHLTLVKPDEVPERYFSGPTKVAEFYQENPDWVRE